MRPRRSMTVGGTALVAIVLALTSLVGCSRRGRSGGEGERTAAFAAAFDAAALAGGVPIAPPVAAVGGSVEHRVTMPTGGADRTYHLYVPSGLRGTGDGGTAAPGDAAPLLLALHGGGGTGTQFEEQSRFDELAEANGFIVAYPDGTSIGRGERARVWNGGRCCGPAADGEHDAGDPDDVAFLAAVVDDIAGRQRIDRARVVVTGHSNGSIMAIRFACERADVVVAVASQAGPLVTDDGCTPSQPLAVLALHGTADANVPYGGGTGIRTGDLVFPAAEDNIATIAAADACPGPPHDTTVAAAPAVRVRTWQGCAGGTTIGLVTVEGAAHAWMGAEPRRSALGAFDDDPYPGFDASAAAWSFLAAQHRP